MRQPVLRSLLVLVPVLLAAPGCTSSVAGKGDPPSRPPQTAGSPADTAASTPSAGSEDRSATTTGASGAPAAVEALFAAPAGDVEAPDSLHGVWAAVDGDVEHRISVRADELTFAERCKTDGTIAFVIVKTRRTATKITLLESRSDRRGPYEAVDRRSACSLALEVDVAEWLHCSVAEDAYECWDVGGGQLVGPQYGWRKVGVPAEGWIKLSD